MPQFTRGMIIAHLLITIAILSGPAACVGNPPAADGGAVAESSRVAFRTVGDPVGALIILIDEKPIAEYVVSDEHVLRPYVRHLRTRSGVQVTRTHPPVAGSDPVDHPTMHPGLWLAFGDLGGADFWRNRGRVRHERFLERPQGGVETGRFAVSNVYEADGCSLCHEECHISIQVVPSGYLLRWTSKFTPASGEVAFGDQEEMRLGLRVVTPIAATNGGEIVSSEGRRNEAEVWGRQADWCVYRGTVDEHRVGVALMPHPTNFRRSWFHARDYGLLVANPFGRRAFTKGDPSRVVVTSDKPLTLQFGIFVLETSGRREDELPNLADVFRVYVGNLAGARRSCLSSRWGEEAGALRGRDSVSQWC